MFYTQVLADGRELPLYGAGGFKFIWNPKFDAAMVAFLECLQELQVSSVAGRPRKLSGGLSFWAALLMLDSLWIHDGISDMHIDLVDLMR